jgi:hypothetical protein
MCSLLLFQPHQLGLWSTSQLSLWIWSLHLKNRVSFRCLLFKVISFVLSMLYIKHCLLILPLFVAICVIWLSRLTYGVYLVLSLKPGATSWCTKTLGSLVPLQWYRRPSKFSVKRLQFGMRITRRLLYWWETLKWATPWLLGKTNKWWV